MANEDHVAHILKGSANWNSWRDKNLRTRPDLSGADLSGEDLKEANLSRANLRGAKLIRTNLSRANLTGADLREVFSLDVNFRDADLSGADLRQADLGGASFCVADLSGADFSDAKLTMADFVFAKVTGAKLKRASFVGTDLGGVDLSGFDLSGNFLNRARLLGTKLVGTKLVGSTLSEADLRKTDLSHADLSGADLSGADLKEANLSGANLRGANLSTATLVSTDLTGADLTGCLVYGVSAWNLQLDRTKQQNLVITGEREPEITIDNIEVAQFIYLMLHNQKVRDVIDTITSKVVLILGRFTNERKAVLDALRDELRKHNYLPILFDFDVPATRDITETVSLLARMARFIIADLTDPSSIPKELEAIVPTLAVPVQPLLEGASRPYAMFKDNWKYDWVLPVYRYEGLEPLLAVLAEKVIAPAEGKVNALQERRRVIEAELAKPR
jgi:uncharacterized protein YjbI with pentapeptide repeats